MSGAGGAILVLRALSEGGVSQTVSHAMSGAADLIRDQGAEILRLRAELAALHEPAGKALVEVAKAAIEHVSSRQGIVDAVLAAVLPRVRAQAVPHKLSDWHEGIGPVLWWRFPVDEAPYVGTPNDLGQTVELYTRDSLEPRIAARCTIGGWPGYHTHWTPLPPPPDAAP